MNTIQNQKIGLYIGGTKSRQSGFNPLMITDFFAGDEDNNMDKSTVVIGKPVYVIKHTNDYILYLLIDKKVNPCDRDTLGTLSIALTITRDMQLADGKSPYTLLKAAYDKFRAEYMEPSNDGCDRFLNKDVNRADFIAIMNQYPLERRVSAYIPMNPSGLTGTLCVPQEKMADLFRDSQYPEFGQFKEIEISDFCQTTPGLEYIEIPRPVVYSIKVNGKEIDTTMSQPDDEFDTASVLIDTEDVEYERMHFTLENLLNAPEHQIRSNSSKSSVALDKEHNCIVCRIYDKPIRYTLEYQTVGGTKNDQLNIVNKISFGEIKLVMGNNIVPFYSTPSKTTTIPASWVHQTVIITPNYAERLELDIENKNIDDENRTVTVTIQITAKATDIPVATFGNRHSNLNYPDKHAKKGKEIKDDYEEKWNNQSENNDNDNNIPPKKINRRDRKKWIFLIIGLIIGMCIGFGSWGIHSVFYEMSQEDSLLIYKSIYYQEELKQNEQEEIRQRSLDSLQKIKEESLNKIRQDSLDKARNDCLEKVREDNIRRVQVAKQEKEKETAKQEILDLVNKKDLISCRNHKGWMKHLTQDERYAVENVLKKYTGKDKKTVDNVLKDKYNSWDELLDTRKKIITLGIQ